MGLKDNSPSPIKNYGGRKITRASKLTAALPTELQAISNQIGFEPMTRSFGLK